MNIISITPPQPPPAAQAIADSLLAHLNAELHRRAQSHIDRYKEFWDSAETPDAILAAMGANAVVWLQVAQESVRHMHALAQLAGGTVYDVVPAEYLEPRREFIVATNGTVSLAPVPEPESDGSDGSGGSET